MSRRSLVRRLINNQLRKGAWSHGALRFQPAADLTRLDREPLRCRDYLVVRLVRPWVQARQSAVRRDAALPELLSVPGVRNLVSRR